jgi:hypothetical protein
MGAASQRRGSLWLGACCLLSLVVAFQVCACQRTGGANKKPLESEGLYPRSDITTPLSHRSLCRNWHLDSSVWLPGFIGPFPSTSLDKSRVLFSCRLSWQIIAQVFAYCQDFDKPGCEKVISITFRLVKAHSGQRTGLISRRYAGSNKFKIAYISYDEDKDAACRGSRPGRTTISNAHRDATICDSGCL